MSEMLQDPRIAEVWYFWVQLSPQQRQELLSVDLDTLQQRARSLQEQTQAGVCMCVRVCMHLHTQDVCMTTLRVRAACATGVDDAFSCLCSTVVAGLLHKAANTTKYASKPPIICTGIHYT
jgi:hypothetical protein